MTAPAEGLRKVLALERQRKFANTAVIGGLDAYLLHFAQEEKIPPAHRYSQVLQSLPPGGYHALHPVQRATVVDALLGAIEGGLAAGAIDPQPQAPPPPASVKPEVTPGQEAPARPPAAKAVPGNPGSPVSVLTGRRRALEGRLARLGIRTIRDLLFHFPTRYEDYSAVRPIAELNFGEQATIIATVRSSSARLLGRKEASEAVVEDETGSIRVVWWRGRWVAQQLKPGMRVAMSGKIDGFRDHLVMENPEWERLAAEAVSTRRLVPVYPLTDGLFQRDLRPLLKQAVDSFAHKIEDTLPNALRLMMGLPEIARALAQAHFPDSQTEADAARMRFAFEELLHIELGVVRRRREWEAMGGAPALRISSVTKEGFVSSLPFALTSDQSNAIDTLLAGIAGSVPMSRLLEGDVGSGKTVVAAAALLAAVAGGYQGAIMAPTEILAEQHFRTLCRLLSPQGEEETVDGVWFQEGGPGYVALRPPYMEQPVRIALLRGGLKAAEKAAAQEAIARGDVDIAVGTHALVQQDVEFPRLGLAVVDEQHRFGVAQRAALREKGREGQSPHVLVMTATPIPRTLALTVYGDLDITVLREMPPGRPEVKTHRVTQRRRQEAYDFLRKKVSEGRQAYVICPLVEESDVIEAKAAVQEYERLSREVFPEVRLGLLHGRMSPAEKDAAMRAFRDGEMDVLVSTAVVEVGIDVPNATVMLIEAADRFGLTQLHQFRGRVRRSSLQAHCLLLSETVSPEAEERLQIMVEVSDGFKLAEEDLRLRGAGDYFGTRQSGMPDLRLARVTDVELIERARAEATTLLDDDPDLARPEHAVLRAEVAKVWDRVTAEAS